MFTIERVRSELEESKGLPVTSQNAQDLAALIIIHDHMCKEPAAQKAAAWEPFGEKDAMKWTARMKGEDPEHPTGPRWKAGTRRSEYEADEPSYDPMEDEPSERMPSNVIPMHEPRGNYRVNRQIGFGAQNSMHQDERMSDPHSMGKAQSMEGNMEFDRQTAEKWVRSMRNEDKAHPVGGKWSPDMLKPLAQKYGIPTDGKRFWEFYAMTNAMYSDYGEVARKFGITSPEFYVCLAKAWMNDKDAEPDKTALYYEHIVKKD